MFIFLLHFRQHSSPDDTSVGGGDESRMHLCRDQSMIFEVRSGPWMPTQQHENPHKSSHTLYAYVGCMHVYMYSSSVQPYGHLIAVSLIPWLREAHGKKSEGTETEKEKQNQCVCM